MRPPDTPNTSEELNAEDKLGFIMFECGLEGVSVKIVKKSQVDQTDGETEDKLPEEKVTETAITEEEVNGGSKTQTATPRLSEQRLNMTRKISQESRQMNEKYLETPKAKENEIASKNEKDNGNVSSCVIELKVVWFNFAAPPPTPITKKIDYTRLDWNLLSTASPAINAWMNPSNRLAIRVVHMVRSMYRRSTATVACLMTEALDIQGLHMLTKSRYGKLTPLSKTLQDDPSCQLCSILQKYYLEADCSAIESNLRESEIPQLFTLRQVRLFYI